MSLIDLFLLSSPFVQSLMGMMVMASIWSWGFIFTKVRELSRSIKICKDLHGLVDRSSSLEAFLQACVGIKGELTTKFCKSVARYMHEKSCLSMSAMEVVITEHMIAKTRGIHVLASVGSIVPFVGLLGTVWGIMSSFRSMVEGSGLSEIAPGIAESLLATAVGLIVAIPATLGYNSLESMVDKLECTYTSLAKKVINLSEKISCK